MKLVTAEQLERDATWLKNLPTLDEINSAAESLDTALAAMRAEIDRLYAIIHSDPGYSRTLPAAWRFLETEAAKAAHEKLLDWQDLPCNSGQSTAADFVRKRPDGSKQKYPVRQWLELARKIRRWIASK